MDWDSVWYDEGVCTDWQGHVAPSLEVASLPGKGRGVRAVSRLRAGTLLLAERAMALSPEPELVQRLVSFQETLDVDDPRRICLNLMCDGGLLPLAAPVPLCLWPPKGHGSTDRAVDLCRMQRIVDLNAYRCAPPVSEYAFTTQDSTPSDAERHQTYGLFVLGALFNHSCAPNMAKVLLRDWVFLRAARDVEAGEELTQFYCDVRMPADMRQKELRDLFGFTCNCRRCAFEISLFRGGEMLKPYRSSYSCQLPLCSQAQFEGLVAEAEAAGRSECLWPKAHGIGS